MGEVVTLDDSRLYPNLPFHPLAVYVAGHDPLPHYMNESYRVAFRQTAQRTGPGQYIGNGELGFRLGVHERTVDRWWTKGIKFSIAEDLCDRLHIHPSFIWAEYYYCVNDAMAEVYA